jgi:hypothetical protein
MRPIVILALLVPVATLPACKSLECATGTIERDGRCEPADETTGTAKCGPFTELAGDVCVPMFPPTQCDPSTTEMETDSNGVITCIGTGGGGCSAPLACPTPTGGKQTICGQLYNFADNSKFALPNATGAKCQAGGTGPCALQILAYNALAYGMDPINTPPLTTGSVYIDDCGRYKVPDIQVSSEIFIGLGVDDAGMPFGPAGVTNTTGVAVPKIANHATKELEAWVVDQTTTNMWTSTGGPMLSTGIYVGVFRTHKCDVTTGVCTGDKFANQSGVTFVKQGVAHTSQDYYFQAETNHLNIDMAANVTSINGTVLYTGASVADNLVYSGMGGLTDTTNCQWETHAAASLANIVFFQVYRPEDKGVNTCAQ